MALTRFIHRQPFFKNSSFLVDLVDNCFKKQYNSLQEVIKMPKKKVFEIVQQLEHLGTDVKTFVKIIESVKHIKDYALIVHDKDVDKEGKPVLPHLHCAVRLDNANRAKTLSHWIIEKGANIQESNIEFAKGRFMHMLAYLTHENAPEKHQYDDSEVISNFEWKKEVEKIPFTNMENLMELIESGEIREYNKTKYIPMHTMVKYKHDIKTAFEWRRDRRIEEIQGLQGEDIMPIDVIYIEGASGCGKTTYAKMLCDQKRYSYCVSSSGNDPLQDYKGQDALILDDLRADSMTASDLLKLLDNHTRSSVRSRYSNKWLFECKLIIITSVLPLNEFFKTMKNGDDEPIEQFRRRCETLITMDKQSIKVRVYDSEKQTYDVIADLKNTIKEKYQHQMEKKKEKAKGFILDMLKGDEYEKRN